MSTIENIKNKIREFGLTTFAVDNKVTVLALTVIILFAGYSSYRSMPKESFPEISLPEIYVNTPYFGNSAADIETLVTRHIEKEIGAISEIKNIKSTSMQDFSIISAEFDASFDFDLARDKIKDAVDRAKPSLPNDLTSDPEVLEINLAELPIMTINLSGDFSNDELRGYGEYLQEKLEDTKGVSDIDLKGTRDREVSIKVDLAKMQAMEVSFGDIENAIRSENITMSGGEIVGNNFRRSIRIVGEFENVAELQNMIVKSENMAPIFLKDIADVEFGLLDRTSIARADLFPVVSLDVIKKSGTNLLELSDNIKVVIDEAKVDVLPEGLGISLFNDQSEQTRMMVDNLENSIISGVILVILVLLFFLGGRNAVFVGIAIPLSMLMGILLINALGYTLNMIVLFSLILALGLLVDNAIVVVENIYRYRQDGFSPDEASKYGTGEVAIPIIASTATTLAAFAPLAFWPGIMGSFMSYLPVTLILVLASSLFVALVINPVLTSKYMTVDDGTDGADVKKRKTVNILIGAAIMILLSVAFHFADSMSIRNILWFATGIALLNHFALGPLSTIFQNSFLPLLERMYNKVINFTLGGWMPTLFFLGTIVLFILSFVAVQIRTPKVELFPVADPLYINAFVEMPLGTDIIKTDEIMQDIEQQVVKIIEENDLIVEAVLSQVGEKTGDPNAGPDFGATPNKARLTVSFVSSEKRVKAEIRSKTVMDDIRNKIEPYPGVKIVIDQNANGPPQGKPINIELSGNDVNQLADLSEKMIAYINSKNLDGIEELKKDVALGKPEMTVNIDREAARRYGVSTYSIADAIRTTVFGKEVSKFKVDEDDYPINLRANDKSRYDVGDIMNQTVTFRNPANGRISQVPISSLADIDYSSTYDAIKRKNQERVITISSNLADDYEGNAVVASIKDVLADFELPEGYQYKFTGGQEEQQEQMDFLLGALAISLFLIIMILLAQFNSMLSMFVIFLSIIFSLTGVLYAYAITGMDFVIVMTGVGIISLAGIVVNNAIVLVDYINLLIGKKREESDYASIYEMPAEEVRNAIIKGGATRLRPVLLTAITTVLGLIPLAIGFNINFATLISDLDPNIFIGGDNADFWGAMAWTVIYGLIFSTFLTLVIVPVMYWLAYRFKMGTKKIFG